MTITGERITGLLLTIQNAFLDTPGLQLTLEEARLLFGVDRATCRAILKALEDASVLTRTPAGAYTRLFPMLNAA
jgi:hypothetical protein